MKLQRTGAVILVAATAAMLAASNIDAMPPLAFAGVPTQEREQVKEVAAAESAATDSHNLASMPADATWGSVFSANWR